MRKMMTTRTGCVVVSSNLHGDNRGSFTVVQDSEMQDVIRELGSRPILFKQTNVSRSHKNVVRGMHFQIKNPQGKLIRVLNGRVIDAVIDLRGGSGTYGQVEVFDLNYDAGAVYIPPGFAHGFWAQEDNTIFHYMCTEEYDAKSDGGINPMDASLDLPWIGKDGLIVSEKDLRLPKLSEERYMFGDV